MATEERSLFLLDLFVNPYQILAGHFQLAFQVSLVEKLFNTFLWLLKIAQTAAAAAHHHQQAAPYIIAIDNFNDARAFSSSTLNEKRANLQN